MEPSRQHKMNTNNNKNTTSISNIPNTFPQFTRLPPELCHTIWKQATRQRTSILEVKGTNGPEAHIPRPLPIPPTGHVSRQARYALFGPQTTGTTSRLRMCSYTYPRQSYWKAQARHPVSQIRYMSYQEKKTYMRNFYFEPESDILFWNNDIYNFDGLATCAVLSQLRDVRHLMFRIFDARLVATMALHNRFPNPVETMSFLQGGVDVDLRVSATDMRCRHVLLDMANHDKVAEVGKLVDGASRANLARTGFEGSLEPLRAWERLSRVEGTEYEPNRGGPGPLMVPRGGLDQRTFSSFCLGTPAWSSMRRSLETWWMWTTAPAGMVDRSGSEPSTTVYNEDYYKYMEEHAPNFRRIVMVRLLGDFEDLLIDDMVNIGIATQRPAFYPTRSGEDTSGEFHCSHGPTLNHI